LQQQSIVTTGAAQSPADHKHHQSRRGNAGKAHFNRHGDAFSGVLDQERHAQTGAEIDPETVHSGPGGVIFTRRDGAAQRPLLTDIQR